MFARERQGYSWPTDKDISVSVSHGPNQPSQQRLGIEMGLHQQRHCQFELKEIEKIGCNKGKLFDLLNFAGWNIKLFSFEHALFFKAREEWSCRKFKGHQGFLLGFKRDGGKGTLPRFQQAEWSLPITLGVRLPRTMAAGPPWALGMRTPSDRFLGVEPPVW